MGEDPGRRREPDGVDDGVEASDEVLEQIGGKVLDELLRRLDDPASRDSIPGTGLMQMANSYVKIQEKKLEKQADGPVEQQDELQVIMDSPLPDDRKRILLGDARDRYAQRIQLIDNLLEGELDGER